VLGQCAKISYVRDAALTLLLPARVAQVEVTLNDGTRMTDQVDAVRGTVRNPMSRAEVADKAWDLIGPVLGAGVARQLIDAVFAIETVADIRTLRPLLQKS
jgi:2-methylcitrate dehydratase PrpD